MSRVHTTISKPFRRLPRAWIPYLALAGCLLLTAVATYYTERTASTNDRLRFEAFVRRTSSGIEDRLGTYVALLRAGRGLFDATRDQVDREHFRRFALSLEARSHYPGIQGIGFSARIAPGDLAAYTVAMRRQGMDGFHVWPNSTRPVYHAIIFLEPLDKRNQAAIGYDMFTNHTRQVAMERARDTGRPAATGKVTLVQEIYRDKQAGFLIYLPVYRGGSDPGTVEGRRKALIGFIYSPFRADDFLDAIVGSDASQDIDFHVFDGNTTEPAAQLHDSRPMGHRPVLARYTSIRHIAVEGRPWTLAFIKQPDFTRDSEGRYVPLVFFGGLVISLTIFGLTRSQARAEAEAERIAEDLRRSSEVLARNTADIEALNEQLRRAMTETHHRVKNNLQIIAAMVDMRLMDGAYQVPASELERLAGSVRTLAAVHDILTQQAKEDGKAHMVSARAVLERLLPMLQATAAGRRIHSHLQDVQLTARQGTSLALITNELVSNAVKYGRGDVGVDLKVEGDRVALEVTDDGPGFPDDFDSVRCANTGLELVDNLSRWDLGGEARYSNRPEGGARVAVSFPAQAAVSHGSGVGHA